MIAIFVLTITITIVTANDKNNPWKYINSKLWFNPPWALDVNWTCIRRSEDILNVFWTSCVRSIYERPASKGLITLFFNQISFLSKIISTDCSVRLFFTKRCFAKFQSFNVLITRGCQWFSLLLEKWWPGFLLLNSQYINLKFSFEKRYILNMLLTYWF